MLGVAAREGLGGEVLEALLEGCSDVGQAGSPRGLSGHLLSLRVVRESGGACDGVAAGLDGLLESASPRGRGLPAADGALGSFAQRPESFRSELCGSDRGPSGHADVARSLHDVSHGHGGGSGEENVRDFLRPGDEGHAEDECEEVGAEDGHRSGEPALLQAPKGYLEVQVQDVERRESEDHYFREILEKNLYDVGRVAFGGVEEHEGHEQDGEARDYGVFPDDLPMN